jgi:flavin reductase (DIM6/NTAB) family NADH-FMN oxidoreductase RutF
VAAGEDVMTDPSAFVVPSDAVALAVARARDGRANLMTCQHTSPKQPPGHVWLGIRHACLTNRLIKESGDFVVAFPSEDFLYETDVVGCVSGRDVDKFAEYGIAQRPAELVSAPLLCQCRLNLECRLVDTVEVSDIRDRFDGEIVRVHAPPECLAPDGGPDLAKCRPLVQRDGHYWTWGYETRLKGFFHARK